MALISNKLLPAVSVAAALVFSVFSSGANAAVYSFDVTTTSGTVLDLNITANNPDSVLTPGFDITKVTGTVGGVSVSNYSGSWGTNGDQVSSGLYLDPYLNQNPAHFDGNGTNVSVVQNPPGSGGWNVLIDNIYYAGTSTSNLSYQGGIALLLSNGASYYVSANNCCSNGSSGPGTGDGQYYDVWGGPAAGLTSAVPELSTWAMLLLGFAGLGFMAYRRKQPGQQFRFA